MLDLKDQNFGVEFEFTGISRQTAAQTLAEYFGTSAMNTGSSYHGYFVVDEQRRKWKIMGDASINPERVPGETGSYDSCRCELVTPVCSYNEIETIRDCIRALVAKGAKTNSSCGIHIHVDGEKHTAATLRNLTNIIYSKEDILAKALGISQSRLDQWCQKTEQRFVDEINKFKNDDLYNAKLASAWYDTSEDRIDDYIDTHYDRSRYRMLNLHSYFGGKGVEFRCFNGTTHTGMLKAYIQFCLAVNAQSINQKRAMPKKTITDNEAYTFRTWLIRIGLNGDEFKTCRYHMLKRLEGTMDYNDKLAHEKRKVEREVNERIRPQVDAMVNTIGNVDNTAREQIIDILRQQAMQNQEQQLAQVQTNPRRRGRR